MWANVFGGGRESYVDGGRSEREDGDIKESGREGKEKELRIRVEFMKGF